MLSRALALAFLAAGCGQAIYPWDGGIPVDPSKPKIVALSPDAGIVEAGGSIQFAFTVDAAPSSGVDLTVTLAPPSIGSAPATVRLPGGQRQGTFTFTGGTAWAEGTVSVTGGSTATSLVMVARGLVISELAPGGPADPDDEFVELYNPTSAAISLAGFALEYSSLANPTTFNAWHSFSSGSISSHGFYAAGKLASSSWDTTASGSVLMGGSGGAIRLRQGSTTVDQLGWGGGNAEGSSAAAPGSSGSLERKARSGSTASSMSAGEDRLLGNSYDSGDNATDFVIRSTREPQSSAAREP